MESLRDRLTLARTTGDENSQAYLQLAISSLEFNKGRLKEKRPLRRAPQGKKSRLVSRLIVPVY